MDIHLVPQQNLNPEGFQPRLFEPEEFWVMLFDELPLPLLVFDRQGRLMLANDEAVRRLDLGGAGEDYYLPDHLKPLKAGAFELERRGSRSRVVTLPAPADGAPIVFSLKHINHSDGLIMAVGQPQRWDEGQRRSEALDETAAMATAVRQQVNGPLSGIELYASIVGQELEEAGDSALVDLIEQIRFSVREVNEYLTSFSSMAEPLSLNLERHQLMDIVDEALGALNGVFKERDIGILVTQQKLSVEVDRGLMVQLFLNLMLNAVEAMPDGGRVFMEFETRQDGYLEIIITDTGPGVALDRMKKIFSPFYTTKNQPLGLGLPVSQRIVEAHHGRLIVGSDLNLGARAVVSIPYLSEMPTGSLN